MIVVGLRTVTGPSYDAPRFPPVLLGLALLSSETGQTLMQTVHSMCGALLTAIAMAADQRERGRAGIHDPNSPTEGPMAWTADRS
jgi:hypothetical protein